MGMSPREEEAAAVAGEVAAAAIALDFFADADEAEGARSSTCADRAMSSKQLAVCRWSRCFGKVRSHTGHGAHTMGGAESDSTPSSSFGCE